MFIEAVKTINNKREIKRVKTSLILWSALACLPVGGYLISIQQMIGAFIILTLFPCLLIYPLIRFFFFGGKDSVAAVVTTAVVEEATKSIIKGALDKQDRKK